MPSIGHLAVGLAAARVSPTSERVRPAAWAGLLAGASYLPDLDVLAFDFGIPYGAPFGHRGALHSLAAATLVGLVVGLIALRARLPALRMGLVAGLVMASHGVLDAFTDGGRGIALLWPFSNARYFAPWRPIPVAPIGLHMLSRAGLSVALHELLLFLPLFVLAAWPRRPAVPLHPQLGAHTGPWSHP